MPSEDTKILEFNQYQKSDKAPFIIHRDIECISEKNNGYNPENNNNPENNPENSSTTKVCKHIPSGFSMSTIFSFRSIENNHKMCKMYRK